MTRFRAAIIGGSGFAGAELARRLLVHPAIELCHVYAADHIGEPIARALPHLEGQTALHFEELAPQTVAEDVDVLLMGLPVAASVEVMHHVKQTAVKVIDLSGAFRLRDPEVYAEYYGMEHPEPELLPLFVYGLPEVNRAAIRGARFVASPGCFATAIQLALLPLARSGFLQGTVDVVAATGSSGSGAMPTPTTHHPVRAHNLRTYKVLHHPHAPEIEAGLQAASGALVPVHFVPLSAPLTRGILATAFARVSADVPEQRLREAYESFASPEPFIRVPERRLPEVVAVAGGNHAEIGLVIGPARGGERTVVAHAAVDNLVKGGAGQAIQNMNLMLGLAETTALEGVGTYP